MECLSDSLASHPENIFHHLLQQMGKKSQRWNVHSKCNEECTAYMAVKSLISKIHLPKLKESNSAQSSIEKIAPPNLKKKKIKITSLKNPIET
jgi:hypothetical protein